MTEQPIQQKFKDQMRAVAEVLDTVFNGELRGKDRKVGFTLLVFDFDGPKNARTNYISNADRKDMLLTMKEFIARAEGRILDTENIQ